MKNYIMTHKPFESVTSDSIYVPLVVGANKNIVEEYDLKDNSFEDNISDKNSSFCELTGMYWIWKHSSEDIVGISHYRRYFTKNRYIFRKSGILSEKDIRNDLTKYDVIVSLTGINEFLGHKAGEYFNKIHDAEVWESCRQIISEDYPEYLKDFEWFEDQDKGYICNMSIMKKEVYDTYCDWLFDILFKLDKTIDYSKYDNYNKRMVGFVAERLLNVWIKHQALKVKEYPIYFTEDHFIDRVKRKLGLTK
ncbi:DUF4422 domain-containing protein [Streptococcus sp. SGI.013]|uniref:DUF4422 domain-containing protein n=1 Tax=unclassified Streptococcus TaxID=2608887 RepID=UPI003D06C51A